MPRAVIFERVQKIIAEQLGVDEAEIKPETSSWRTGTRTLDLSSDPVARRGVLEEGKTIEYLHEDAEKIATVQERSTSS